MQQQGQTATHGRAATKEPRGKTAQRNSDDEQEFDRRMKGYKRGVGLIKKRKAMLTTKFTCL